MVQQYPFPAQEPLCTLYTVTADGQQIPAYSARCSAVPFNQVWPGYQRPLDQTEIAAFVSFGLEGEAEVVVRPSFSFHKAIIRPLSKGIVPSVENGEIRFSLLQCGQYTLELDGHHKALHLFANPVTDYTAMAKQDGVLYFGPGVHHPGKLQLHSGDTVVLDKGAVVHTALSMERLDNISILGEGIFDNSTFERGSNCIRMTDCTNIRISGITVRDACEWTIACFDCENVQIDNVKLIGMWRYNSDGTDFCNCTNCTIKNSFLRNFDDCIVVKGIKKWDNKNVCNIFAENCVLWCDWGRALEVGAETCADRMEHIAFRSCDVIHSTHIAMDVQHGDRADIRGVLFEDIRVEYDRHCDAPYLQTAPGQEYQPQSREYLPSLMVLITASGMWSKDQENGEMQDIVFRNIVVDCHCTPPSSFSCEAPDHTIQDVTVENLTIGGKACTSPEQAGIAIGKNVRRVCIR